MSLQITKDQLEEIIAANSELSMKMIGDDLVRISHNGLALATFSMSDNELGIGIQIGGIDADEWEEFMDNFDSGLETFPGLTDAGYEFDDSYSHNNGFVEEFNCSFLHLKKEISSLDELRSELARFLADPYILQADY